MNQNLFQCLLAGCSSFGVFLSVSVQAQIIPDNSLPNNTVVTRQDNVTQINGGTTKGTNLFHSFQDFSVPTGSEAFFNNALDIENILSRVTGGNRSNIDGLIRANGTANLFLINPAGIMFGKNASLSIGGSFIGSTADSILFPDSIEFSATNTEVQPILTIDAPIGLGFRDNPGAIVNPTFDEESYLELGVAADKTLALIGGEISINGGVLSTEGGRIELGSVGENSTVSLTPVPQGWDFGYEGVENFRDINLSGGAYVESSGENTGDIQVRGRNINLSEASQIGINTEGGQAGNLEIIASESVKLEETVSDPASTFIFSDVSEDATGEDSQLTVEADRLEIKGGQIGSDALGSGKGVNVEIKASEIELEAITEEVPALIFAYGGSGDGGNLTVETGKLTANQGAQINASTFAAGNAGNLSVNATESIELIGTAPDSNNPSGIVANVEKATISGNGGDIAVNTPRLILKDGAQIATAARNQGNGGTITIDVDESILLSGFSPLAKFRGKGISGIFVSAEPSFEDPESGAIIPTSGNGGTLDLTAKDLILEKSASISADTFSSGKGGNANINVDKLIVRGGSEIRAGSLLEMNNVDTQRGAGGNLKINASDSIEITGTGKINDSPVNNSSLLTLAESNGDAGNLTLTTGNLSISNGGEINASASDSGAAGNLDITANNLSISDEGEINASASDSGAAGNLNITADSLDLEQGILTAATAAGTGGNIKLTIDDRINLSNNSLISAAAKGNANGGNITIDSNFIVARPNQNNDIIASAAEGTGGRIEINTKGIFGLQTRSPNPMTNDIDASGGVDGEVILNTPDVDVTRGLVQTLPNIVEPDRTVAQTCKSDRLAGKTSGLTIVGKGNIPPAPTEPFNSENILLDGKISTSNLPNQLPNIPPIKTSIGDIVPARGIVITEDGGVILTANNVNTSTVYIQANCIK